MVGYYGLEGSWPDRPARAAVLTRCGHPTGPLVNPQARGEATARGSLLRHQRESTANKIVTQALVEPGDIVLLDRTCPPSQSLTRHVMAAGMSFLCSRLSAERVIDVRRGADCARSIQRCWRSSGPARIDRVQDDVAAQNAPSMGIVYDVEQCPGSVPRDQARIWGFLWDDCLFVFV